MRIIDIDLIEQSGDGDIDSVKYLLESGANINVQYSMASTPLISAIAGEHFKVVKLLLEYGANVNYESWIKDDDYEYPLQVAIIKGNYEIVKILLEYGADILMVSSYYYLSALTKGNYEIVKILLEYGANPDDISNVVFVVEETENYYDIYNNPNILHMKSILKLYKLKSEIKKSVDKKQFIWQELCSQLNQEGKETLFGFAKLLDIPVNKDLVTKRQLCLLLSEKMYDSVTDCQDDNLSGDPLNELPGWRIFKIDGKCRDIYDLDKLLKSGETRDPYTRQELPIASIKARIDILEKLSKTNKIASETLFDRVLQNPIFSSDQYLLNRIGVLFSDFPYSIDPEIITKATNQEMNIMISKLFETFANEILKVSSGTVNELKRLEGIKKKILFVDTLIPLVTLVDGVSILLYNAFVSFSRKRKSTSDQGEDLFEMMIS